MEGQGYGDEDGDGEGEGEESGEEAEAADAGFEVLRRSYPLVFVYTFWLKRYGLVWFGDVYFVFALEILGRLDFVDGVRVGGLGVVVGWAVDEVEGFERR